MPQDGYGSVSAPEDKIEQASDYKPDGATWGEVLVAGAERLNENLASDMAASEADADGHVLSDDVVDEIVTELAERVEPEQGYIDDDKIARAVAAKIDYAQLANAVAGEVEGRMR